MIEKIKEPFVECSFCHRTVESDFAIRAKKAMMFIDRKGNKTTYPSGTTICRDCLEAKLQSQ